MKDSPGLGTFDRSQHEFLLVLKIADGKHISNFQFGQHGRTRSNVWQYAGMSSFGVGRDETPQLHATPKPVAMLVDAILDCSNPGDLMFDPFGGAGSTQIAAEGAHRRGRLIEEIKAQQAADGRTARPIDDRLLFGSATARAAQTLRLSQANGIVGRMPQTLFPDTIGSAVHLQYFAVA